MIDPSKNDLVLVYGQESALEVVGLELAALEQAVQEGHDKAWSES